MKNDRTAVHFVNQCLDNIQYPHTFNRKPKDIGSYEKWKASELRTCMLYIVLPIFIKLILNMKHSFPEVYLSHFIFLWIYVRTLRCYSNRNDIKHVSKYIHCYLYHFGRLYGTCRELYSTHALVHLWEQVQSHGGLAFHR